ncbi:hemicentin-2 isoform X3 [Oncorhynchus tshawytscha]|uniref:hemicentin-2 isoform X3 n=1 Tax=Oncorhynchus tshawytscha TaxID=74940 RepID=UPI000D0A0A6C|nr:hemicentin-2 isoform X3 [Oncorhynchus tshawytscha]
MKDTHTLLNLLLLLVYLAACGCFDELPGSALTTDGGSGSTNGPLELTIVGPDFVKVGVPRSFDCAAQCSPSCSYRMSIDGQIWHGNELLFTARQWEESLNLTCTARNDESGRSSTVTKILQVLAGPTNVSITGPALMTPGAPQSFQCNADCRPSCNYTWKIKGRWLGGQGNKITVTPEELATSATLNCKAINSVSGLYAMATRTIPVTSGPSEVHVIGPDSVAVGFKSMFQCTAKCTPACDYHWTIDGHTVHGSEMEMTVERNVKSEKIMCHAQNTVSTHFEVVTKSVRVEENDKKKILSKKYGCQAVSSLCLSKKTISGRKHQHCTAAETWSRLSPNIPC